MKSVFDGRAALAAATAAVAALPLKDRQPVTVVFSCDPASLQYKATEISAKAKVRAFRAAGIDAEISGSSAAGLVIRQRPLGQDSGPSVGQDLDLSPADGWTHPAVCVAAGRLLLGLDLGREPVAVVGAHGFFGRHLCERLTEYGHEVHSFDLGSDLRRLKAFKAVAAVAGAAGILTDEHLTADQVVLDLAFAWNGSQFIGNVAPEAARGLKFYTPVPGGMGPLQMIVLLERYLETQGAGVLVAGGDWPRWAAARVGDQVIVF